MLKYRLVFVVFALGCPAVTSAQATYVSPGFHIGYRFGEGGGVVTGVEVSIVQWGNRSYGGVVLAWDGIHGMNNFHVGFEYGSGFIGACVGPVVGASKDTADIGLRITPYAGAILIPYYTFQFFQFLPSSHQVGMYVKFPIPTGGGSKLRFGEGENG